MYTMTQDTADQLIAKLPHMNYQELATLWAQLFGMHCYSKRKDFLRRRLQWRINTLVSGGLSERALKRADEIADETLIRLKARCFHYSDSDNNTPNAEAPKPDPTLALQLISRVFKGQLYEVYRHPDGSITYLGKRYRSLSEVSSLITGYYISGNRFFNLPEQKRKP